MRVFLFYTSHKSSYPYLENQYFYLNMKSLGAILILLFYGLVLESAFSQTSNASSFFNERLEKARTEKDFNALAATYLEYAIYENDNNRNSSRSFEYLSRSQEYFNVIDDTSGVMTTQYFIGQHFLENDMFEDAKMIFENVLDYHNQRNDILSAAKIHVKLTDLYLKESDADKAKLSIEYVNTYLDSLKNINLRREHLLHRIQFYQLIKDFDTALELANDCYENSLLSKSNKGVSYCLAAKGDILFLEGDYAQSIYNYKLSLPYLQDLPYDQRRLKCYKNLATAYKELSLDNSAFEYLNKYSQLHDSILSINRTIAINNVTYQYQSEQKSREIKLLELEKEFAESSNKQQKRALTVLGIASGFLLLAIYFIISFYKEKINNAAIIKQQNDKINQQKIKELEDQIQIESMQSMLSGQESERERISKDLHDSLGGLLSTIKLQVENLKSKASDKELIPSYQKATELLDTAVGEVRSISQNLQPVALSKLGLIPAIKDLINRYSTKHGPEIDFQFFDIPPQMDQMVALGIFRIIQELLNNAIKHADANEIIVQLYKNEEDIIIHVEDDGKGFNPKKNFKSMGLENIKSRINYLKGSMEIDSRRGIGTSYLINVKYDLTKS